MSISYNYSSKYKTPPPVVMVKRPSDVPDNAHQFSPVSLKSQVLCLLGTLGDNVDLAVCGAHICSA